MLTREPRILEEYFEYRLELYAKRKENQIESLSKDISILQNKIEFVKLVNCGEL